MKKAKIFIMALLAIAGMSMSSCNSCNHDADDEITSLNFESVVRSDYEAMCNNVDSEDTNTVFFEARAWFDTTIGTDTNCHLVKIMTVFQTPDSVIMRYHMIVNEVQVDSVSSVCDRWIEDCKTDPYNRISLDEAIANYNKEIADLNTNYVVMRRPLNPMYMDNNYYIFGTVSGWLTVNAATGEIVTEFTTTESRLSSEAE